MRWSGRAARVLVAGALLAGGAGLGRAAETKDQYWPELDVYARLNSSARMMFMVAPVRNQDVDHYADTQLGIHYEVGLAPIHRPRLKERYDDDRLRYLRFRTGYRVTTSYNDGDRTVTEQRIIAELTPRYFLPGDILVALRNRFDFRWLSGEYSWRYRPRLWLEREFRVGRVTPAPYASAEFFYDSRYDDWSRTRYQIGVTVPATKWLVPEVYYCRQIDRQPSLAYTNALGMVVSLHF